jgi:hypothetical protein
MISSLAGYVRKGCCNNMKGHQARELSFLKIIRYFVIFVYHFVENFMLNSKMCLNDKTYPVGAERSQSNHTKKYHFGIFKNHD